jgi:hypothetical protein
MRNAGQSAREDTLTGPRVTSRTACRRELADPGTGQETPFMGLSRMPGSGGPANHHAIIDAAGFTTDRAASPVLTGMGSRACF